jgi:1,4-alpha-glucan branching enzyme
MGNGGEVLATSASWHGMPASAQLTLPPLSVLWLEPVA